MKREGYVGLVDHALAQREVGVGQVGEGLQQDLGGDRGLEEGRVELVPETGNRDAGAVPSPCPWASPGTRKAARCFRPESGSWTCLRSDTNHPTVWLGL